MAKDLLIFPETEEDSKKIYESLKKEDSGLIGTSAIFRPPKKSAEAKVEDSLSVVMKDVDIRAEEEDHHGGARTEGEGGALHQQNIRTWHPESEGHVREEGRDGGSNQEQPSPHRYSLLQNGGVQEEDQNSPIYRCQRFGHAQDSCKARDVRCGKCAGPHRRAECTARASYCANCTGNNLASDGSIFLCKAGYS